MHTFWHLVGRWIEHMNMTHWMVAFAVAVALGAFLLRGMGSRANY